MDVFSSPAFDDHEQVLFFYDRPSGLRAIIALHDTTLGPAVGGCRFWPYASEVEALTAPVALGPDAPEAGEDRYITELVRPPDPTGPYGPYAYGLSGSDNQLANFTAGSDVIALHGTGDPTGLGGAVPYGSIAMSSDIVIRLADTIGLPLGTPVEIVE